MGDDSRADCVSDTLLLQLAHRDSSCQMSYDSLSDVRGSSHTGLQPCLLTRTTDCHTGENLTERGGGRREMPEEGGREGRRERAMEGGRERGGGKGLK